MTSLFTIRNLAIGATLIITYIVLTSQLRMGHRQRYAVSMKKAICLLGDVQAPASRARALLRPAEFPTTLLTLPLSYESGVFLATVLIRGTKFRVVPDTGSSYMIVAGKGCNGCNVENGIYAKRGIRTGATSELHYGSQDDQIEWYIDELSAPGSTLALTVEFGVVSSVKGASHSNIFGLATSLGRRCKAPVIDQLMFHKGLLAPYFYFDFTQGAQNASLTLGGHARGGVVIPFLDEREIAQEVGIDLGYNYYMVRVTSFKVDGKPIPNAPRFCMVDTGNTKLSCGTSFWQALKGPLATGETLEIELGGKAKLTYDIDFYLQRTVEPFPAMLDKEGFDGNVCILGNQFMLGRMFSFDLHKNMLAIV